MHVAIIGRGLIGSAAARHLSGAGVDVTLIGPDEPVDKAAHNGVFASHYDEGRITRALDPHAFWSRASIASIARYREIEAASGIRFFTEAGTLIGGPASSDYVAVLSRQRAAEGIVSTRYEGRDLADAFPYFAFEPGTVCFHEAKGAGHISPRRLVQAQGIAAQSLGAQIIPEEVLEVSPLGPGVEIRTSSDRYRADAALIAAGGFTQKLCPVALPLTVFARTVAFYALDPKEAARLAQMPALVFETAQNNDPYLLPPIRYPDGRTYLKLGGDPVDRVLTSHEDTCDWFRSGGNLEVEAFLTDHIQARMPGLRVETIHTNACVTTFTPSNLPIIGPVADGISVAVAGCGRGAKCSDELGRIAAEAVVGRTDTTLSLAAASG